MPASTDPAECSDATEDTDDDRERGAKNGPGEAIDLVDDPDAADDTEARDRGDDGVKIFGNLARGEGLGEVDAAFGNGETDKRGFGAGEVVAAFGAGETEMRGFDVGVVTPNLGLATIGFNLKVLAASGMMVRRAIKDMERPAAQAKC